MKLRDLEEILCDCEGFDNPKVELEQYPTSSHIAARMLFTAATTYDDIENHSVGDFGCGAGVLSIASSILGSTYTIGFDVDQDALDNAWVNCKKLEVPVDLVQMDILSLNIAHSLDTVVMNPPFGTRNVGIDSEFVKKGMDNANVVYSLHKTSTRDVSSWKLIVVYSPATF